SAGEPLSSVMPRPAQMNGFIVDLLKRRAAAVGVALVELVYGPARSGDNPSLDRPGLDRPAKRPWPHRLRMIPTLARESAPPAGRPRSRAAGRRGRASGVRGS